MFFFSKLFRLILHHISHLVIESNFFGAGGGRLNIKSNDLGNYSNPNWKWWKWKPFQSIEARQLQLCGTIVTIIDFYFVQYFISFRISIPWKQNESRNNETKQNEAIWINLKLQGHISRANTISFCLTTFFPRLKWFKLPLIKKNTIKMISFCVDLFCSEKVNFIRVFALECVSVCVRWRHIERFVCIYHQLVLGIQRIHLPLCNLKW